jgi:hypothetical protein
VRPILNHPSSNAQAIREGQARFPQVRGALFAIPFQTLWKTTSRQLLGMAAAKKAEEATSIALF